MNVWIFFVTEHSGLIQSKSKKLPQGTRYVHNVQGCQIFLVTTYQNGEDMPNIHKSIPNGHKMYPMAVK
jgi:hypothetical protein